MTINDALLDDALGTRDAAERASILAELFDRIRYGDTAEECAMPRMVHTAMVTLECGTCAYATLSGGVEARDQRHLAYDGAHEPGWYAEDRAAPLGMRLIRSDPDLIQYLVDQVRRS